MIKLTTEQELAELDRKLTKEDIAKMGKSPTVWSRHFEKKVNQKTADCLNKEWRKGLEMVYVDPGAETIFDRKDDWDIVCILDALRYDAFEELNFLPGELDSIISHGCYTTQWILANFRRPHKDTILISANPRPSQKIENLDDLFFHVERAWKDKWDEEWRVVLPHEMNKLIWKFRQDYPDKKIVAFYLQPHFPNVSEYLSNGKLIGRTDWIDWQKGRVTMEEMRGIYKQNVIAILEAIQDLRKMVEGKIVLTSDHGESFGECGVAWTHTGGRFPWLVKVPWFKL